MTKTTAKAAAAVLSALMTLAERVVVTARRAA
jgi:hypothetical protein